MKSQLGDKLAASVREAKQQQTSAAQPVNQAGKPAEQVKLVQRMSARRVWPD